MPSTWTLITTPITSRSAPPWCMCSGVIAMIAIITPCARASAATPAATPGRERTTSRTRGQDRVVRVVTPRDRAASRATSRGSGRSRTATTSAAASMPAAANTNGPVRLGRPRDRPARPAAPVRLGPATAPTVVAQTTIDSARARFSGRARSVAA